MSLAPIATSPNYIFFVDQAVQLMSRKVPFSKKNFKPKDLANLCLTQAKHYLGDAYETLTPFDDENWSLNLRLFLRDTFGSSALHYFDDAEVSVSLDYEHAIVFYHLLVANKPDQQALGLGVLYYMLAKQLDSELTKLTALAHSDKIEPIFSLTPSLYRWKRCPQVLKKYMLQTGAREGFVPYYYERPYALHLAYLLHLGMSFDEASSFLSNQSSGLFISILPLEIESLILPAILENSFDHTILDGVYANKLLADFDTLKEAQPLSPTFNVYTEYVKPTVIDLFGRILKALWGECLDNKHYPETDIVLYHLAPNRVGFFLREGLTPEVVFPSLHQHVTPVPPLDLSDPFSSFLFY